MTEHDEITEHTTKTVTRLRRIEGQVGGLGPAGQPVAKDGAPAPDRKS